MSITAGLRPLRVAAVVALLGAVALAVASRASGQTVRITEPAAWDAGQGYTVLPGLPLRVAGIVNAPEGVSRVLVNGKAARLRPDPAIPSLVRFDISFVPELFAREVTVVVVPNGRSPIPHRYPLTVGQVEAEQPAARPGGVEPPPPPPDTATSAYATIPDIVVRPPDTTSAGYAAVPDIVVRPAPASPWRPYTLRGAGYAAVAGVGVYLMAQKTNRTSEVCTGPAGAEDCVERSVVSRPTAAIGVGMIAGAALVGLVDAALTSRRAHARAAERARSDGRTGLQLPTVETDGRGARIALLRLRF